VRRVITQRVLLAAALAATLAVLSAAVSVWRFVQVQRDMSSARATCECCEEPAQ
jgi:hypothetical protein